MDIGIWMAAEVLVHKQALPTADIEGARRNGWVLFRVSGDSMEPRYMERDLVWVKPRPKLDAYRDLPPVPDRSDIVFLWNGIPQIKRFVDNPQDPRQITFMALNPVYPPLVRVAGEFIMLGVVQELAKRRKV